MCFDTKTKTKTITFGTKTKTKTGKKFFSVQRLRLRKS